jgi:dihydrolipoamide dehydrogenase
MSERGTTADLDVDVAIIGAGSAGLAAHAAARRRTDRLVLIEAGDYGTTCARSGCMPSKLLIAAAEACEGIAHAATFGITVDPAAVQVDGRAVMARVREMRDGFVSGVQRVVERMPASQRLRGLARFVDANTLQVGAQRVRARSIVIATGSQPRVSEPFRALGSRLLTSDNVFDLQALPRSLAVVGGGAIGLELGQAFARLGVRVRLFDRGTTLGPRGDAMVTQLATALFTAALDCTLGSDPVAALVDEGQAVELRWQGSDGAACGERFEQVLVATGRQPNLASLDLAAAGLALDARGIPLHDPLTMRCGDSNIFIAGDVSGARPLLHEATAEGRFAGDNAARFPDIRAHRRHVSLSIAFTDPQYAVIGAPLDAPGGHDLSIGEVSFATQGRSRVIGRNRGIARLYGCRASGKLVGAQLLGPAAEHMAHLLAWSIQHELDVDTMLSMPFYHPVVEEGLRTALKDLRRDMRRGEGQRFDCIECGPGI